MDKSKLSLLRRQSLVRRVHENEEITEKRAQFVLRQSTKMKSKLDKSLCQTMEMSNRVQHAWDEINNTARKKLDSIEKRKPFMPSIVARSQKDW